MENERKNNDLFAKSDLKKITKRKKVSKQYIIDKEQEKDMDLKKSNEDYVLPFKRKKRKRKNHNSFKKNNIVNNNKNNEKNNFNKKTLKEKTIDFFKDLESKFSSMFEEENDKKFISEYYDLPYKYNDNSVRVIAQNPRKLFVYWDIDNEKTNEMLKIYGQDFLEKTYPILLVTNKNTKNVFEVQIDDFANTWYIDIPDSPSNYQITYARKAYTDLKAKNNNSDSPLYVEKLDGNNLVKSNDIIVFSKSNTITTPSGKPTEYADSITFINLLDNTTYTVNNNKYMKNSKYIYNKLNTYIENSNNHEVTTSSS